MKTQPFALLPRLAALPLCFLFCCAPLAAEQAVPSDVPAQTAAATTTPASSPLPLLPPSSRPEFAQKAQEDIDAILSAPEFEHTETVKTPKWIKGEKQESDGWFAKLLDWLRELLEKWFGSDEPSKPLDFNRFFSNAGEILIWCAAFALVFFLLLRWRRWAAYLGWGGGACREISLRQQRDSALDEEIPLPDDIPSTAQRYWAEGRKAEAISLLYRGTLLMLGEQHRVELPRGATEQEIRQAVIRAFPLLREYIGDLTRAWLRLAYAHRPPAEIGGLLAGFRHLSTLRSEAPSAMEAGQAASS
ncbi:MAG: DUF4129 domain-containing protein [Betaproteobacteria bacterium]|nr:DUF4129 domain-containing protein [Betaproteobacteria bacterium]